MSLSDDDFMSSSDEEDTLVSYDMMGSSSDEDGQTNALSAIQEGGSSVSSSSMSDHSDIHGRGVGTRNVSSAGGMTAPSVAKYFRHKEEIQRRGSAAMQATGDDDDDDFSDDGEDAVSGASAVRGRAGGRGSMNGGVGAGAGAGAGAGQRMDIWSSAVRGQHVLGSGTAEEPRRPNEYTNGGRRGSGGMPHHDDGDSISEDDSEDQKTLMSWKSISTTELEQQKRVRRQMYQAYASHQQHPGARNNVPGGGSPPSSATGAPPGRSSSINTPSSPPSSQPQPPTTAASATNNTGGAANNQAKDDRQDEYVDAIDALMWETEKQIRSTTDSNYSSTSLPPPPPVQQHSSGTHQPHVMMPSPMPPPLQLHMDDDTTLTETVTTATGTMTTISSQDVSGRRAGETLREYWARLEREAAVKAHQYNQAHRVNTELAAATQQKIKKGNNEMLTLEGGVTVPVSPPLPPSMGSSGSPRGGSPVPGGRRTPGSPTSGKDSDPSGAGGPGGVNADGSGRPGAISPRGPRIHSAVPPGTNTSPTPGDGADVDDEEKTKVSAAVSHGYQSAYSSQMMTHAPDLHQVLAANDWTALDQNLSLLGKNPRFLSVSLTATDDVCATPLHTACWKAPPPLSLHMISLLPRIYQDMQRICLALDCDGNTALHLCAANTCMENQDKATYDEKDFVGDLEFRSVAGFKETDVLEALVLSAPEAASMQNNEGDTPLHLAVSSPLSSVLAVSILLDANVDVCMTQDIAGSSPLHAAIANQVHEEVLVRLLISCPRSAMIADHKGLLPLHYVAAFCHTPIEFVRKLIAANKAGILAQTEDGDTPLHLAISNAQSDEELTRRIVQSLLGQPAGDLKRSPLSVKNKAKLNPLECCDAFDAPPILRHILNQHAKTLNPPPAGLGGANGGDGGAGEDDEGNQEEEAQAVEEARAEQNARSERARKKEEERQEEEKRRKKQEQRRLRQEERKKEEEKRKAEEEARIKAEEMARLKAEEEARIAQEEEEEAERVRKAEEEAEAARKKAEEDERLRKAEEERIRKEEEEEERRREEEAKIEEHKRRKAEDKKRKEEAREAKRKAEEERMREEESKRKAEEKEKRRKKREETEKRKAAKDKREKEKTRSRSPRPMPGRTFHHTGPASRLETLMRLYPEEVNKKGGRHKSRRQDLPLDLVNKAQVRTLANNLSISLFCEKRIH